MANNYPKSHIDRIENYATSQQYSYPRPGGSSFILRDRNRSEHGNRLLRQLIEIKRRFRIAESIKLPKNIIRDDVIYVQFTSAWGYPLMFDQLHQNKDHPIYQIVNIKQEKHSDRDSYRYHVSVLITMGGISHFINAVEQYLTKNTKDREGNITDTPKFNQLIANFLMKSL